MSRCHVRLPAARQRHPSTPQARGLPPRLLVHQRPANKDSERSHRTIIGLTVAVSLPPAPDQATAPRAARRALDRWPRGRRKVGSCRSFPWILGRIEARCARCQLSTGKCLASSSSPWCLPSPSGYAAMVSPPEATLQPRLAFAPACPVQLTLGQRRRPEPASQALA